ncbi:hypothetical protein ABH979_006256 [Bradyrhizobium ottawaense]
MPRSVADLAQPREPFSVGRAVEIAAARRVDQRGIAGRVGVGMQALQRVDQHAGDVLARAQDVQRLLRHLGEGVGLVRRNRVADAGLHVAPPAVIGAGETNQMRALGVVARQPHRLHHGLGAGHVERDFVEAGDLAEPLHVLEDDGMVGAEHGAECMRPLLGALDALLVEVVAEDVDAVGAREVVGGVAVDVRDGDAARGLHEGRGAQMLADETRELERHAVALGEVQVGDGFRRFLRHRATPGVALGVKLGEAEEGVLTLRHHVIRRAVAAEIFVALEFVEREQLCHPARHLGVPGERPVLGAGQFDPRLDLREDGGSRRCGGHGHRENRECRFHDNKR